MNTDDLQNFNAQLTQGIKVLEQLEKVFIAEREALSMRKLDLIQQHTEDKQKLLEQYLELNRNRVNLLQRLGFEADDEGAQKLISQTPESVQPILTQSWSKLQAKLESLQSKNKINGQVVNRNLKNVEQVLSIISGRRSKDRLYNEKGSAGHYRAQSRIGKA